MLNKFFNRNNAASTKPPALAANISILTARELFDARQFDLAHEHCRALLRQAPGDVSVLDLACEIALKRRIYDETMEWLRTGVAHQGSSVDLPMLRGRLAFEVGDYTSALGFFNQAVQLNPGFAKAHNGVGATLQVLGRPDEAMESYQRAYALDPTSWRTSYNIGNLLKLSGRLEEAILPFQHALQARRGLDVATATGDAEHVIVTRPKLIHDIEQLTFLTAHAIGGDVVRDALQSLGSSLELMEPHFSAHAVEFTPPAKPLAAPYYNRLTNFYDAPALAGGALNRDQDWAAIEAAYFANAPGMTYMDNFLKPEALQSLRRFCLESTIWFDFLYTGGYVGCGCEDGFICPLLAQIAEEQRLMLPNIFGEHRINGMWGYKYDSEQTGISIHADFAAINVNFWLAPDTANLDPNSGGLVIWDKEAPLDWSFEDYNNNAPLIAEFLRTTEARQFVVPHKQNRVVLFNSDLFHKTDNYRFRPGYENRRINVTMLYGDRQTTRTHD